MNSFLLSEVVAPVARFSAVVHVCLLVFSRTPRRFIRILEFLLLLVFGSPHVGEGSAFLLKLNFDPLDLHLLFHDPDVHPPFSGEAGVPSSVGLFFFLELGTISTRKEEGQATGCCGLAGARQRQEEAGEGT